MGIRDLGALEQLAQKSQLKLIQKIEMPVNNLMLVWKKVSVQK